MHALKFHKLIEAAAAFRNCPYSLVNSLTAITAHLHALATPLVERWSSLMHVCVTKSHCGPEVSAWDTQTQTSAHSRTSVAILSGEQS